MPQSDPLNVNESVSSPALCRCKWVCMCMCVCVWPVRSCQQNIETHLQANVVHACCESCQELLQQQPKQKVPTTCCCCQVLFIVFLIPSRSPCCYACRRLFVLGDFALLCLCCFSSYLRTAWRVCVCGSCCVMCVCVCELYQQNCVSTEISISPITCTFVSTAVTATAAGRSSRTLCSQPHWHLVPALDQAQELINKVQANAMTVDDVGRQQYRRQPSRKLSSLTPSPVPVSVPVAI